MTLHEVGGWAAQQASWTEERVSALKRYAAAGWSASQIAAELGEVTRNAVIGKLSRMGKKLKGTNGQKSLIASSTPKPKQIRQYRGPWPAEARPVPVIEIIDDTPPDTSDFACTIAELGSIESMTQCRWLLGEPPKLYCGAPSVGPWCPWHHRIAYRPIGSRRS